MKTFILLLIAAICIAEKRQANSQLGFQFGFKEPCLADEEVFRAYHLAFDGFFIKLYKTLAVRDKSSFTFSPQSVWTSLAAIAEGSDYFTQKELFTFLNLPNELCSREKLYGIATTQSTRNTSTEYISNSRTLLLSDQVRINQQWYGLVQQNRLLEVIPAPIKTDTITTTNIINQLIAPKTQNLDFTGNSVLLNSFDFNGLWTTSFSDAVIEKAPFYNIDGEQVGFVDLMRVVRPVRIARHKSSNMKILELTIGANKEYTMFLALTEDNNVGPIIESFKDNAILEALDAYEESATPVDIAIPRAIVNTELNLKEVLRDAGLQSTVWNTDGATRLISTPAAKPSSYIERTSITFKTQGVSPPALEYPVYRHANKEDLYFSEFIADRPFMFSVFDTETYTCLLVGLFREPTYTLSDSNEGNL